MLQYPVVLKPDDNGTVLVSFPDVPEAHTFGEDEADALTRAVDVLLTAFGARIADRDEIPEPSAVRKGMRLVSLPALAELKILLYRDMLRTRVTKSALARRLDVHLPQVDRLLDLRHQSRLDQVAEAFHAFNRDLIFRVSPRTSATRTPLPRGKARGATKAKGSRTKTASVTAPRLRARLIDLPD